MSWQSVILLQVLVSAGMTLFTRRLTIKNDRVYFLRALCAYLAVAVMGIIYSLVALRGEFPSLPNSQAWGYLLIEGLCIPIAWLVSYKIISRVGASNGVLISTVNYIAAALAAVWLLGDVVSSTFALGATFIMVSMVLAARIKPDVDHATKTPAFLIISLAITSSTFFAIGMIFEKKAINAIGVWDYTLYGWGMQAVFAAILFGIFGWREVAHASKRTLVDGFVLGLITSIAGGLYVYALSKGSLSHTLVAASGKLAITLFLAAVFLGERNSLLLRLVAFGLSAIGIMLIVR